MARPPGWLAEMSDLGPLFDPFMPPNTLSVPSTLRTLMAGVLVTCGMVGASAQLPYQDRSLPIATRVLDLLGRMTPEEKFRQLFMVVGEVGPDSARYANGIFGLQLDRGTNAQSATQQLIGGAQGTAGAPLLTRINASQRFFRERTRLGIPFIPYEEALHGLVLPGATQFGCDGSSEKQ